MNIFLKIVLGIVALIVLILVIALFTKKEYTVERSVTINKPRQQVFEFVKLVKNMPQYSKWWQTDPNVRTTFTGTDGTPGFVAAWDSDMKEAGKGEQEIKQVKEGESIDCEIRFIKPFEGLGNTKITTADASAGQTNVTWMFHGKMTYPMNAMMLFMNMDKMLGKDLEISLNNLKAVLEK